MSTTDQQALIIQQLFTEAEHKGIPLWLESGWAIDARLGRITRMHEDIDIAYPKDQEAAYLDLLQHLGFDRHETMDYGFLRWHGDILIDSEPCHLINGQYNFTAFPARSCPVEKEGVICGYSIRCLSWEALYFEFLGYIQEVPMAQWREKDFYSLQIIEAHLSEERRQSLKQLYANIL